MFLTGWSISTTPHRWRLSLVHCDNSKGLNLIPFLMQINCPCPRLLQTGGWKSNGFIICCWVSCKHTISAVQASFSAYAFLTFRLPQFQYSILMFDLVNLSDFDWFFLWPDLLFFPLPFPLLLLPFFFSCSWGPGEELEQGARAP